MALLQNNNNNLKIVYLNQHILNKYLYYPESISLTQTTARQFKPKGILSILFSDYFCIKFGLKYFLKNFVCPQQRV